MGKELAVYAIAASVIGSVVQYTAQQKAAKQAKKQAAESAAAQRRAEALQQRAADLEALRRRRQVVREARIRRAAAIQAGVSQGIGISSSAVQGAAGSVQTQAASTLSFLDQTRSLNRQASAAFGEAREIASRPITAGGGLAAFGGLLSTAGSGLLQAQSLGLFGSAGGGSPNFGGSFNGGAGSISGTTTSINPLL